MNDNLKTETENTIKHLDEVLKSDGLKATTEVKTVWAKYGWAISLAGGGIAGFIIAYLVK